jgi:ABC-type nitrate/sulfonate/bicarbonate transport system ATPase subunit
MLKVDRRAAARAARQRDHRAGRAPSGGLDAVMVWQEHTLIPWRRIDDNVGVEPRAARRSRAPSGARGRRKRWPSSASPSSRVSSAQPLGRHAPACGIARALVADPRILLMDEPFAAVDAQTRRILQEQVLLLTQQLRKTVVFVTHSIEEALLLGDRIAVMSARPGRIKA